MKYPIKIASAMAAYYAVTGVYQNYISKYFGAQGLTDGEIGVLMAAPPLISLIAQPVWGTLGDRARSKNAVFRLMYVASAILVLSYLIRLVVLVSAVCGAGVFVFLYRLAAHERRDCAGGAGW